MSERDVGRLRDQGFDDPQIAIAAQVTGYFNYINRLADGLGVDDEQWMSRIDRDDWLANKGSDYLSTLPS